MQASPETPAPPYIQSWWTKSLQVELHQFRKEQLAAHLQGHCTSESISSTQLLVCSTLTFKLQQTLHIRMHTCTVAMVWTPA